MQLCQGTTKTGEQCRLLALPDASFCHVHAPASVRLQRQNARLQRKEELEREIELERREQESKKHPEVAEAKREESRTQEQAWFHLKAKAFLVVIFIGAVAVFPPVGILLVAIIVHDVLKNIEAEQARNRK